MNIVDKFFEWYLTFFNLVDYNVTELTFFCIGFLSWFAAYYFILKNVKNFQVSEMPLIVATGNIAWEFCWGFIFPSDLGPFFTWGCRVWFFLDIFINRSVLNYGRKLVTNKFLSSTFNWWYVVCLIGWIGIVYFMNMDGDDNELGVVSALLINVVMSSLYIYQLLNYPNYRNKGFSLNAAWFKMIGTGSISISSFIVWPDNEFLMTMCVLTFILDCVYIAIFYSHKPEDFEQVVLSK